MISSVEFSLFMLVDKNLAYFFLENNTSTLDSLVVCFIFIPEWQLVGLGDELGYWIFDVISCFGRWNFSRV